MVALADVTMEEETVCEVIDVRRSAYLELVLASLRLRRRIEKIYGENLDDNCQSDCR